MIMHIEYAHGYRVGVRDVCLYLKGYANRKEIKINRKFLETITNLIIEKGIEDISDFDKKLWQNPKGEVFDNYEECKMSNKKKK